ncbi:SRPBCC family protein [Ekhidna sp.]|uniref:SRPBCC family protein n=1 Tax=Ekhidna sp. TaxID=2608089 RepID=UPI003297036F
MIEIKKHSGIYTLTVMQQLPIKLLEAWKFFSSPKNLTLITPKHMGFQITSCEQENMYAGQMITYKISPFPRIKINWVTEITHVDDKLFFVDEQRFGPYSLWHHEHHFKENENGVLMTDRVSYKIPFGFLGGIAQSLFVKRQLMEIFNYRIIALKEMFGE